MSSKDIYCRLCDRDFGNLRSLSKHFCQSHKYTPRRYYEEFLMSAPSEGFCLECNTETKFRNLGEGFETFCGNRCQAIYSKRNLKKGPERYKVFVEKTREAVKDIWTARTKEERTNITTGAREALCIQIQDSSDPEQKKRELFSRYYRCDQETIERLNSIGRAQCLENFKSGKLSMNNRYMSGRFTPRNPEKYAGNPENIFYRSSWELRVMSHLDKNDNVLQWASEELCIPYFDPVSAKIRRYFPDFVVKSKDLSGLVETVVIEIKPHIQTIPPSPGKNTKRYLKEVVTWGVNEAKWKAAEEYCRDRNWKFRVITEKELGI